MHCEICGNKESVARAIIEGIPVGVCEGCSRYGKIVAQPPKIRTTFTPKPPKQQVEEFVPSGFGNIIKTAREKKGVSQKDVAATIAERESLIAKIESEHAEPSIALARKLERYLGIRIIETISESVQKVPVKGTQNNLTIGDAFRTRKR